ncbi:MAG: UvrD-helicase domain-containing protein [Desulfosarcina sp.]|nr:UvrD-helicase domain-containing protein [Desulfosarcina sp.]MBC2742878.1 UvrD-helicase domain-containing protein [Desulfosarcina sp.]MBC2765788.1 UvrD-helicase domain-containing protein [Desulfosarcina sp.]
MNGNPSTSFLPIGDIDAVDLSRHALVEASAGTGKTYTIENLVVRLLKESPDLNLKNILLVTFTEKATSELKLRIRQKIEQTLDGDQGLTDAVRKKLGETLDGFDNAAIYTIHGFCHTLLKEFPFETGNLFQQEVIDDGPLLEKLLKAQMRTDWPRRYGHRLEALLTLSNFSANADVFVETAVNLAQRLSDDPVCEMLIPDPAEMDVDDLWQAAQQTVLALKRLVGTPPRFSGGYGRLNINARTKAAIIRDMVEPIERALEQADVDSCQLSKFMTVVETLGARHSSGEANIDRLIPKKWLKAGENLHECPNLVAIKDRLDELVRLFVRLSHVLMLTSVGQLRKDAYAMKGRNGWISYQDMLTRVADFLMGEGADEGIRKIRNRYRVAFVDEFQDTDEVQWRIFSTLFLDGCDDAPDNRLFLIGDPKQAIYAFRGADVFTYLGARQRMKTLAGKGLANLYDLTVNWRSTPGLVETFNQIFSQDAWFGTREQQGPFEIGYTPAGSPDANQLPAPITCDRSQRPPFNVMDLTAAKSHASAKVLLAGFICREIRYLVGQGGIRITDRDGRDRVLHFGDIAILVRSQSEFALIEPLLNELSIPYAYYRKPGLFQCQEARWLGMVLRAVCNPEQAATVRLVLLTPFFDISPASLEKWQELPSNHTSQMLLQRWHVHAQRRHWGPLFQSLMEDSGLIFRHCMDPGWGRAETNFQQLFDYLEASAHTMNLDLGGLVAMLDSLRLSDIGTGSDADIHQIEGEGDKVQILTMHVSKGLEFPMVFIAGGLTVRNNNGGIHVYHIADAAYPERGYRKVIDLTASTGKEQVAKEYEDENKRLYYVALTRARVKLYVPYYPDSRNYRWLGPICRFISQSIGQTFMNAGNTPLPGGWHEVADNAARTPDTKPARDGNGKTAIRLPADHLLPTPADFRHRKVSLESFSSIGHRIRQSRDVHGRPAPFCLIDAIRREDDEPAASAHPEPMEPALSDGLPGGTRMGSMFHHIFENIDFQAVMTGPADILANDGARFVIESAIALYRIEPRWSPQIAWMIATTLRTPIDANGTSFVLGRLTPTQRRHEMEFYFPLVASLPTRVPVPGCTASGDPSREMFIRGFIDLVFSWQGRYYIADWKSNRLEEGFHQAAMAREMASAGYELQYQLYTVAALRWLKRQLGDRFDPYHHFGGAFYFFIRGVGAGGQDGIFHVTPEQLLPLGALQKTIQQQIAGLKW